MNPVPKPPIKEKPKKVALRRTALKKSTKPLPKINPTRKAKVAERRAKDRRSPAHTAAKKAAKERAKGICECGCQLPFDTTWGPSSPDYPEFHHDNYKRPEGRMLRRQCHHRIEMTEYSHRHTARR